MKVSYKKLWHQFIDKKMSKTQLYAATGISSAMMAKMTNGEEVTMSCVRFARNSGLSARTGSEGE